MDDLEHFCSSLTGYCDSKEWCLTLTLTLNLTLTLALTGYCESKEW